jgi:predicted ArsR family transcriptional regulator
MARTMPNSSADLDAVALLAEPVRGRLYEWVSGASDAVGRDEAAAALGITRALAAFHLDRLVAAGLLVAEFRRLTGRSGPGAGRPSKLYRRAVRDIDVSLPGRRYEIPARLFAETIEQLDVRAPLDAVRAAARRMGEAVGSGARRQAGKRPTQRRLRDVLLATLAERAYQPREWAAGEIRLGNCPFQTLVKDHRPLVCGMNLAMMEGLISGLGDRRLEARADPGPDRCCVSFVAAGRR